MDNTAIFMKFTPYVVASIVILEGWIVFLQGREKNIRDRLKETSSNFGVWAGNQIFRQLLWRGWRLGIFLAASSYSFIEITTTPLVLVALVFFVDFIYYWEHRFGHEVRLLWAIHSVHHSSDRFNLSTAIRLPWLAGLLGPFWYTPLVILGFDPIMTLLALLLVLLYQFWIHTEKIQKMGWFDRYFNSPSNHRVHHGANERYLDKNHGGILIVWDRLFGTYEAEKEEVRYGITTPLGSRNPLVINFKELANMFKDMLGAPSLKEAALSVFGRPGRKKEENTRETLQAQVS